LRSNCEEAMNYDLNTPIVLSHLFEATKVINLVHDGKASLNEVDLEELKAVFSLYIFNILGLTDSTTGQAGQTAGEAYKKAVDLLLNLRMEAKQKKDWATSDKIRNELAAMGIEVKDTKDGFEWKYVG